MKLIFWIFITRACHLIFFRRFTIQTLSRNIFKTRTRFQVLALSMEEVITAPISPQHQPTLPSSSTTAIAGCPEVASSEARANETQSPAEDESPVHGPCGVDGSAHSPPDDLLVGQHLPGGEERSFAESRETAVALVVPESADGKEDESSWETEPERRRSRRGRRGGPQGRRSHRGLRVRGGKREGRVLAAVTAMGEALRLHAGAARARWESGSRKFERMQVCRQNL